MEKIIISEETSTKMLGRIHEGNIFFESGDVPSLAIINPARNAGRTNAWLNAIEQSIYNKVKFSIVSSSHENCQEIVKILLSRNLDFDFEIKNSIIFIDFSTKIKIDSLDSVHMANGSSVNINNLFIEPLRGNSDAFLKQYYNWPNEK